MNMNMNDSIHAAIKSSELHRENRTPAPLIVGGVETRLTKWLRKVSWTPTQGALLACGFDPDTYREKSYGQDIKGAKGLCGGGFMGNHHFEGVERVLRTWGERIQCPEKVTPADFVAWCEAEGIDTRWLAAEAAEPPAAASASAPALAVPAPVATPAEAVPVQRWAVKKVKRFPGYSRELNRLLRTAHTAGSLEPPTAQNVLDAWAEKPPHGITRVMPDGFEYFNGTGATKEADRDAIRKAIHRMVDRTTSGR